MVNKKAKNGKCTITKTINVDKLLAELEGIINGIEAAHEEKAPLTAVQLAYFMACKDTMENFKEAIQNSIEDDKDAQ